MESQTDGVEWVLGVLFGIGILVVLIAAFVEFRKLRRGDLGGDASRSSNPAVRPPPDDES